ncbi:thioesterase [Couchioplanes caeruleus subsp. azureus]|nr:thioesterase [Couchioplanes caeruleus subsp. azureus]
MTENNAGGREHSPSAAWHQDAIAPRATRNLRAVDGRTDPAGPARLHRRRHAVSELGDALRTLVELSAATEAPVDDLARATESVRAAAALLGGRLRDRSTPPSTDDLLDGVRMYNPVTGSGSALAPPLHIEQAGDLTVGTCTLGLAFEGPPSYAHGGVSALLLDQLLGYAVSASGHPGMTVRLDTSYRAPVPLQTPLRLTARVTTIDGRRVTASGSIATAAEPDAVLVAATGTFVALSADQARRLFGAIWDSGSRAG